METHALRDPIQHNVWANNQIVKFCMGLEPAVMNQTVPGTYGTLIATLRHIAYCEMLFLDRLLGRTETEPYKRVESTALADFNLLLDELAADWQTYLAGDADPDRLVTVDVGEAPARSGILISVVLYHGSEHRGQMCTILGALGLPPPELTPWAYAAATNRLR